MNNLKIQIKKLIEEIEQMIDDNALPENIEIKRKKLDELLEKYLKEL